MSSSNSVSPAPMLVAPAAEMAAVFRQLQRATIRVVLVVLAGAGLALMGLAGVREYGLWAILAGAVTLAVVGGAAWLEPRSFVATAMLATAASVFVVLAPVYAAGWTAMIVLLAAPVGLMTLAFGVGPGAAAAGAATLWLALAPPAWLPVAGMERLVAAMSLWLTWGLIWLTLRPLLTAVEWSWLNYERSRALLEESREYQLRLQQTLQDLTEANVQLTRVNRLAVGLQQEAEAERLAKQQFVANVSHELRTPINMVIGFSEMILRAPETYGAAVPSGLLADLEVILRNSQHLASLIDDVLDLSQIEAGKMALVKDRVALREVVDAACVAVRPLFESKHLTLTVDVAPELPAVTCDRTRIREVVLNLLSNAGRFTAVGGVDVRAWQEGNHVVVCVADTGSGLSSDDQARLFQPFQQLGGARRHDGTGLGLSISKSFVELHDGKMWVESEQGAGTSFFFSLPIASPPLRQSSAAGWLNPYQPYVERVRRPEAPPPEIRPRLVIVESDSALQRLMQRYGGAIDVTATHTLAEALAEAERTAAQAVLVNSAGGEALPAMVEEVRRSSVSTPVLACAIAAAAPALLDVAEVLVKPFTREMLLAALARLEGTIANVLLVEDEPDAQLLYRRMLASSPHGYRVLRANNGVQALEILQRRPVDAIVLDLVMPEMDGYEFLAYRRRTPEWAAIPVILTSARDPSDLPVTSRFLTVTVAHGIGARKLLDAVQVLSALLSPAGWPGGAAPQETPPG